MDYDLNVTEYQPSNLGCATPRHRYVKRGRDGYLPKAQIRGKKVWEMAALVAYAKQARKLAQKHFRLCPKDCLRVTQAGCVLQDC